MGSCASPFRTLPACRASLLTSLLLAPQFAPPALTISLNQIVFHVNAMMRYDMMVLATLTITQQQPQQESKSQQVEQPTGEELQHVAPVSSHQRFKYGSPNNGIANKGQKGKPSR